MKIMSLGSDGKHYLEGDLGRQCMSVINNGHAVISIPAVQLYAPASLQEDLCDQ